MRALSPLPLLALLCLRPCPVGAGAAPVPPAPPAPPALEALTYSGDQSALESLDSEFREAGADPRKLTALEERLVALLRRPEPTFAARQAACQRLTLVLNTLPSQALRPTTARALAGMLAEERDAELARQVLEQVPGPAAEKVLLEALPKATGRLHLGLIDSLGRRRAAGAVPALASLLTAPELVADATVPGDGQLSLSVPLQVKLGGGQTMAGYRTLIFYP